MLKNTKFSFLVTLKFTLKNLSKYLSLNNENENNLVLLENASSAFNSVLLNWNWKKNDKILFLSMYVCVYL